MFSLFTVRLAFLNSAQLYADIFITALARLVAKSYLDKTYVFIHRLEVIL